MSAPEFYAEMRALRLERVLDASVEIGRACVAKPYRNRRVLYLLWRGIAEYVLAHGKRYVFGCSSLTSQDPSVGLRAHADLTATFREALEPASRVELAEELAELHAALDEARDVLTDEALHSAYLAQLGEP